MAVRRAAVPAVTRIEEAILVFWRAVVLFLMVIIPGFSVTTLSR